MKSSALSFRHLLRASSKRRGPSRVAAPPFATSPPPDARKQPKRHPIIPGSSYSFAALPEWETEARPDKDPAPDSAANE
jgi:hypothetical protein